jgi:hypothetical protein
LSCSSEVEVSVGDIFLLARVLVAADVLADEEFSCRIAAAVELLKFLASCSMNIILDGSWVLLGFRSCETLAVPNRMNHSFVPFISYRVIWQYEVSEWREIKDPILVTFIAFFLGSKNPNIWRIILQFSFVVCIKPANEGGLGSEGSLLTAGRREYQHASALPSPWTKAARASWISAVRVRFFATG